MMSSLAVKKKGLTRKEKKNLLKERIEDWERLAEDQKNQIYLDVDDFEDWYLQRDQVKLLEKLIPWVPTCDASSDP